MQQTPSMAGTCVRNTLRSSVPPQLAFLTSTVHDHGHLSMPQQPSMLSAASHIPSAGDTDTYGKPNPYPTENSPKRNQDNFFF